ncbi:Chromosome partition protein Smc [Symmachiella dynata]|uniref:c-type cytochrome domain-containing protein n=1 Tax=Symmachiella dynata TaxID=2527995 RepID=UPI00118C2D11|nr:c-type cytochrome domain-containing protein [Symmachiella dynata]QDT50239.1 Chromosome partition protein Smc [Symmachiella dynata]
MLNFSKHQTAKRSMIRLVVAMSVVTATLATVAQAADKKPAGDKAPKINFIDHVLPILRQKCGSCHNTDKKTADLDLTSYIGTMQGGGSGPVIEPGSASDSYLFELITHQAEPKMPPDSEKMPAEMLAVIEKWIDGGALETAGSKAMAPKKPKFDFSLKGAPTGKPEGPPPMPGRLNLEPVVHTERTTAVTALATSPWAPLVAVSGQQQVLLYHSQTLAFLGTLPFPEGVPHVLKFSSTGDLLLAAGGRGGASGRVVVWNIKTGERVIEVGDELDAVLAADISADQTMVALGGPARVVRIYSTADGSLLHELKKHTDWIYSISFSPDGVLLATGDRNGGMFVWEGYTAREYASLRGHSAAITGLTWRSDSNILASSSEDGGIRLWEMENGGNVKTWSAHGGGAAAVEFTRDGRLVSCGRDRTAKLWDQAGKQLLAFPSFPDIALRITHCDETNHVIAGDWSGAIHVWNAADGKPVGDLTMNPATLAERLTAAEQQLAVQQAELKKQTDANTAAQAAATKATADVAAAKKAVADTQAQHNQAVEAAKAAKAALDAATAEHQAVAKTMATLDPLVPLLKESATKAQEAAAKNPEDKELAAAVAQLAEQMTKNSAALEAAKKALPEKAALLEKSKQALDAADKQVVDTKAAFDAAGKQLATVEPLLKPAVDKAAATQQAVNAVTAQVATSQAAVARWQNEIEFTKKLTVLAEVKANHAQLAGVAAEAAAELKNSEAQLVQANTGVATAEANVQAANTTVQQTKDAIAAATAQAAKTTTTIATLDATVASLNETAAKAAQAVEKSGGDADVAAITAQVKVVVDKKNADLAAAKKSLEETKAALAKAKTDLAAAEKNAVAMVAALEAAKKVVVDQTAAVQVAKDKFAAAKQAADAAEQLVEKTQDEVKGHPQLAGKA